MKKSPFGDRPITTNTAKSLNTRITLPRSGQRQPNSPDPIAVLVSPDCISACEGFAYALTQDGRATIVGNYPTAGAFGEVGRGQYDLPGDLSAQFPTGRSETINGDLIIEGKGVQLDITVPVTEESTLGIEDTVLNAAIDALSKEISP